MMRAAREEVRRMNQLAGATTNGQESLLDIQNLTLSLRDQNGWVEVLNNVSFSVKPREILGVVGESGCGKSMTALSILRLLPPRDSRLGGRIMFNGQNLVDNTESQMSRVRGRSEEQTSELQSRENLVCRLLL